MDIYHKNKRFLIAFIIVLVITAIIIGVNNPTIRLSPESVFQENMIPGDTCKCIITGEDALYYGALALEGRLTVLKIENIPKSYCLDKTSCEVEVRVKKDNLWERKNIVGTAAYSG